ncbi:hypothetical protein TWF106_003948 [Orbilia oligospora]|uniref:Uncharacterized protein n=1 Tax=Orbilia oligospora TaxID=2813651 RepID=A0A7C8QVG1_ORBOL|nr:hypothetical protein TWF106_003948 [Orbilia oligospora]
MVKEYCAIPETWENYAKDDTNTQTNNLLNACGFWLMAEALTKRGNSVEAKFYTFKIPKNMDEGIHFNWANGFPLPIST